MNCDDALRARIARNLALHAIHDAEHLRGAEAATLRRAAVAVVVIDEAYGADLEGLPRHDVWSERAALLLTRRSERLSNHAGQWALPGGRCEAGETAEFTARRETLEEVGLELPADAVLGRLDDFVTRSGFIMTPIVLWGGPRRGVTADEREVASIHRIPVREFMRSDAPVLEPIPESEQPVLRMPVGESWIAAPTAAILYQFREVALHGRSTRVAHYEQPLFAWR